jgi:hypothetical protein
MSLEKCSSGSLTKPPKIPSIIGLQDPKTPKTPFWKLCSEVTVLFSKCFRFQNVTFEIERFETYVQKCLNFIFLHSILLKQKNLTS